MSLALMITAFTGILASISNTPGFENITAINSLCTSYNSLANNTNTSTTLNSTPVTTFLGGSTIPHICNGYNLTVQALLPQVQLSLNLLKPFINLTGLDPNLNKFWHAMSVFNGLPTTDPKVEALLMEPKMRENMTGIWEYLGNMTAMTDMFLGLTISAAHLPSTCANPNNLAVTSSLKHLLNGSDVATFCAATKLPDVSAAIAAYTNTSLGEIESFFSSLPMVTLVVKVLEPFVGLGGMKGDLVQLVQGLTPLGNISVDDTKIFGVVAQPGVAMALVSMDAPTMETSFTEFFTMISGIPTVCANITSLSHYPHLQTLLNGTSPHTFCPTLNINSLATHYTALIKKFLNATEFQEIDDLKKSLPQIQLTVKVMQPFMSLSNFNAQLGTLVRALSPLVGMGENDTTLYLVLTQPALQAALKSMESAQMETIFNNFFETIGAVPTVCENNATLTNYPGLVVLLNGTNVTTLCNAIDINTMGNLLKMVLSETESKQIEAFKRDLPLLLISVKILRPYIGLPGFDSDLRGQIKALSPFYGMNATDPRAVLVLMQPKVQHALTQMALPKSQDAFRVTFSGVGVLPSVCSNVIGTSTLTTIINSTNIDTVCSSTNLTHITTTVNIIRNSQVLNISAGLVGTGGVQDLMKLMPVIQLLEPFSTTFAPIPLRPAISTLAPLVGSNDANAFMVPNILTVLQSLATNETKSVLNGVVAGMASLPEACNNKEATKSFLHLVGNSDLASLCNQTDSKVLKHDLEKLANITAAMAAGNIPNIPGIPAELLTEIPKLLANIPGLQALAEMDGADPEFVKIVAGLAPLKGMALNDPKLGSTLMEKTVLTSLLSMVLQEDLMNAALRKATLQLKDLKMLSMVEGVDPALIQLIKPLEAVEQVNIDDPTAVMNFLMQPTIAAVLVEMGKPATRQKLEDVKTKFLADFNSELPRLKDLQRMGGVPGMDPTLKALVYPLERLSTMKIDDPDLFAELGKSEVSAALLVLQSRENELLEMEEMVDRYYIGYCCMVAFIFFFNTVLYITYFCMTSAGRKDLANILLLNQAFSDIIVAFAVLLQSVYNKHYWEDTSMGQCALFFLHYSYYLSCNCLLVNAFERMTAFKFPLTHAKIFTSPTRLFIIMFIVYFLSSIPPMCHSAYVDLLDHQTVHYDRQYSSYMTTFFVLLLLTVLACYCFSIVTCFAVNKRESSVSASAMEMKEQAAAAQQAGGGLKVSQKSYIGLFLAHSIFFAISYLPVAVIIIIDISDGRTVVEHWLAVVIVYMMSALFNPIVTLIFKDDYRNTLLRKKKTVQQVQGANPNA